MGGCLYAIGGMDSPKAGHWGLPLKTVERYDPAQDKWTEITSMNEARFGCAVAAYQVSKTPNFAPIACQSYTNPFTSIDSYLTYFRD